MSITPAKPALMPAISLSADDLVALALAAAPVPEADEPLDAVPVEEPVEDNELDALVDEAAEEDTEGVVEEGVEATLGEDAPVWEEAPAVPALLCNTAALYVWPRVGRATSPLTSQAPDV